MWIMWTLTVDSESLSRWSVVHFMVTKPLMMAVCCRVICTGVIRGVSGNSKPAIISSV